ncbi:HET-domain-containing protein [Apiospora phragmitis]|uniref:HET-domain-containing protein n=1 Tax=Apiospora phragmitis TaxID=2905665 RepID=A0ABR1USC1_9PEZI
MKVFDLVDCFAALVGIATRFEIALARSRGSEKPRYLAGLWEPDMAYSLMWSSGVLEGKSRLRKPHRLDRQSGVRQPVERALSWFWMALLGPVTLMRVNYTEPCCFPARADGCWCARGWGIDLISHEKIQKALPFAIKVRGHFCKLRVSPMRVLVNYLVLRKKVRVP